MLMGKPLFQVSSKEELITAIKSEVLLPSTFPGVWANFLSKMLVHDFRVRPKLNELQLLFEDIETTVRKEYLEKEMELSILSLKSFSVRPIQKKKVSRNWLEACRKYHSFLMLKHQVVETVRMKSRSYLRIKNIRIYLIRFLAFAAETAKLK